MLKAMYDNNVNITTREDANQYWALSNYTNGFVIKGVGSQFALSASGRVVTLAKGEGVVQGRHIVETDGTTTLTVPASSSGHIAIRYDINKNAGSEAYLIATATLAAEDLTNNGTIRDLPLYTYVSTATSVTLTDERLIPATFTKLAAGSVGTSALDTGAVTRVKNQYWEVAGTTTIGMGGGIGTYYYADIKFGVTFRSIPAVVGCAVGYAGDVYFTNITTTGCRVWKAKTSQYDVSTDVNWIAREKGV